METRAFFDIMGTAPATVTVVTTLDRGGKPQGLTVAAVVSVSAGPPLLLICVDRRSRTLPALLDRGGFVVNFLRGDRADIATRFAARLTDRFAGVAWRPAQSGLPILHRDSLAHAECRIVFEIEAGDHIVLIARVEAGSPPPAGSRPLMYFRHRYGAWSGAVDDPREPVPVPRNGTRDDARAVSAASVHEGVTVPTRHSLRGCPLDDCAIGQPDGPPVHLRCPGHCQPVPAGVECTDAG